MRLFLPIFILLFTGQYLHAQSNIHDADNNTKVTTEAVANEDRIRFYLGGTQKWSISPLGQWVTSNSNRNIRIGFNTGNSLTSGADNVFMGYRSGQSTTSGGNMVGIGKYALQDNTTGYSNIALGTSTLANNTTGYANMGIGTSSLLNNTTGRNNTAVGVSALSLNVSGLQNIAIGTSSLYKTTASSNVGIGYQAGYNNTSGNNNIMIGNKAGYTNSTGVHNTYIGGYTGYSSTGSNNVFIGYQAGYNETSSDKLYIDNSNTSNPLIYGNFATNKVGINGKLGVGTENPAGLFDVYGAMPGSRFSQIETTDIGGANDLFQLKVQAGAPDNAQFMEFERGSTVEARINTDGSAEFESASLKGKTSGSGNGNLIVQEGSVGGHARITFKDNSGSDYWDQATITNGASSKMNFWYYDGASGANIMTIHGGDKRVGIGTTSPSQKFEVNGGSMMLKGTGSVYHNVQSTSSGGNSGMKFLTSAGGLGGYIYYNNTSGDLRFFNQGNSDLVIEPDGTVGIGTNSASGADLVIGTGTGANVKVGGLLLEDLGSSNLGLDGDLIPHSNVLFDLGNNNVTQHWDDCVADDFINFSDRRLKKNINEISYGLEDVMKLKPMQYQYIEKISRDGNTRFGLIAQDVEQVIPELIRDEDVDMDPKTGEIIRIKTEFKAMNYIDLIPVLVKAIQEQQVVAEEKEDKIAALEAKLDKIDDLDAKLAKIDDLDAKLAKIDALDAKLAKLDEMSERLDQFSTDLQYCCSSSSHSGSHTIPVKMDKTSEMPYVEQNMPNPFTAQTEIKYYIPRNAQGGVMQITDRNGKVLKTVTIKETGAGKVVLDANELAAGSYFYTFMVDGKIVDTMQMLLTK